MRSLPPRARRRGPAPRRGGSLGRRMLRLRHVGPALRLVWNSARGWTIASVLLVVVQGLLPLAAIYLMKLVVDAVEVGLSSPEQDIAFGEVAVFVALMGAVALISAAANSLSNLVGEIQGQAVSDYIYDILHAKSVEVDLAFYESAEYYDALHRAQREGPYRPVRIVKSLIQIGQSSISLVGMIGLLLLLHWSVALVLFATALPDIFVRLRFANKSYKWQRERTTMDRQSRYYSRLLTGSEHAKEVRLFDLGSLFIGRFRDLRRLLRREKLNLATWRTMAELGTQVFTTLAIFGAYAFIAYQTMHGRLTMGDLVMYFAAVQRGQSSLRQVMAGLSGLYENSLFLSDFYEFLDLEPQVTAPPQPHPVPQPMQVGINLEHVSFQYPTGSRRVLEDVSLTIRPGEHVALVGENGSGKTTLIKLLCRLYDPTRGEIALDGVDLKQFDPAALRREISVVFQDYARYHLTAWENIWFGNVTLPPDPEPVAEAARQAGADDVIGRLPQGYDSVLGKWFQDGEELSIGEWQKVALARAFYRDSQIIVLDEPTSALDAKAEYEVFKMFHQLARGRTAILISHRFSTVRLADRIYVLDEGRIIEGGSHDELIRHGGRYAHLFETQAQHYR